MKSTKKIFLRIDILERFLGKTKVKKLMTSYERAKKRNSKSRYFEPNATDWKLYRQRKLTLKQWKRYWKLKTETGTLARLGRMYFKSLK